VVSWCSGPLKSSIAVLIFLPFLPSSQTSWDSRCFYEPCKPMVTHGEISTLPTNPDWLKTRLAALREENEVPVKVRIRLEAAICWVVFFEFPFENPRFGESTVQSEMGFSFQICSTFPNGLRNLRRKCEGIRRIGRLQRSLRYWRDTENEWPTDHLRPGSVEKLPLPSGKPPKLHMECRGAVSWWRSREDNKMEINIIDLLIPIPGWSGTKKGSERPILSNFVNCVSVPSPHLRIFLSYTQIAVVKIIRGVF